MQSFQKGIDWKTGFKVIINLCLTEGKYLLLLAEVSFLFLNFNTALTEGNESGELGLILLATLWISMGYVKRIYTFLLIEDADVIIRDTFYHWLRFVLIALVIYPLLLRDVFHLRYYLLSLLAQGIFIFVVRVLFLSLRKKYKSLVLKNAKVALIGNNVYARRLERYISQGCSHLIVGRHYNINDLQIYPDQKNPYTDIYRMAKGGVKEIYCCLSGLTPKDIHQLLKEADRYMIRVKFLPNFSLFNKPIKVESMGQVPIITLRAEPLQSDKNKIVKRFFDIVFSLFVIVFVLSWAIPVLWICMRLEGKGPLFFRQKRSGINNKVFNCYKFRSMTAANATANTRQATRDDERITRVGAFIRKTSIDELPQFFNVLIGNMSVVGPRPHMLAHTAKYRKEIGTYMVRHYVKPGITGLAQVEGFRGETQNVDAMKRRVELDIKYLENWSFFIDMKVIFLTVWNVLRGEDNAY